MVFTFHSVHEKKRKSDHRYSWFVGLGKKWRSYFQTIRLLCFSCLSLFWKHSYLISALSLWFNWLSVECRICWGTHSLSVTTEPSQREPQGTGLKIALARGLLFEAIDMKLRPCKVELSIPQQPSNEGKRCLEFYLGKWNWRIFAERHTALWRKAIK